MGTRNFTSVILDGKQVVCQYCQWDGYPTYTGVKILEFLRDVNIERLKEALRNTKITTPGYDDTGSYTGSTKKVSDVYEKVSNKQTELNKERQTGDEYFNTYQTTMLMLKNGELTAQEVDDFIVSTRDTGCDILPFIYERSLEAKPLELFAFKEEFAEVQDFATNKNYVGFPGCDAQGYYMINLDTNTIKLAFDDCVCEYSLDTLPQNIDKEMFVFQKTTEELYERVYDGFDFASLIPEGDDEKGAGGLWDLAADIAVGIGTSIREDCPELLGDAEKEGPVYAEDFGQELIYKFLCVKAEEQRVEKEKDATALNELKEHIEEAGWSVDECSFGNNISGWELSQHSPAGEDFFFAVEHNNKFDRAVEEIRDYADEFDTEEHIEMLVEARRNGFAGVPDTATLVEDANDIQEMLNQLADSVESWAKEKAEKKPALDEVIGMCECDCKSAQQPNAPSHDIAER